MSTSELYPPEAAEAWLNLVRRLTALIDAGGLSKAEIAAIVAEEIYETEGVDILD